MKSFFMLASLALVGSAFAGLSGTELVVNGSFENPSPDSGWTNHADGPYYQGSFLNWNATAAAGHWNPTLGANTFSSLPDGICAGFTGDGSAGGVLSQDLHHVLAAGDELAFFIQFGDRSDLNSLNVVSSGTATLKAGSNMLASMSYTGFVGDGAWHTLNTYLGAGALSSFVGQSLSLELSSAAGSQMSYDLASVQLTPTPEPATMAVLGLGVLGLARRKRQVR